MRCGPDGPSTSVLPLESQVGPLANLARDGPLFESGQELVSFGDVGLLPGDDHLGPAHPPKSGLELKGVVDQTAHLDPLDTARVQ